MDKKTVPSTRAERDFLTGKIEEFARGKGYVPPLTFSELRFGVSEFLSKNKVDEKFSDWLTVILSNAVWRDEFFKTPINKRLLILPQCLKNSSSCSAKSDEIGLICESCGKCNIHSLQDLADSVGALSLVSDSTSALEKLFDEGCVSAVLGVSCLDALERSFDKTLRHGITGIAVPLFYGGCKDTSTDFDLVKTYLTTQENPQKRFSQADVLKICDEIFSAENLEKVLGLGSDECSRRALETLSFMGNRWRPRLFIGAYLAASETPSITDEINFAAIALECFHKASLIHDDIEDADEFRDGCETLHLKIGVGRAINVGDFLVGLGYWLISKTGVYAPKLLTASAQSHKLLCVGQDADLLSLHSDSICVDDYLKIYAQKTGGAFAAALNFASIFSKKCAILDRLFEKFSETLGVAYQIYDDMRDKSGIYNLFVKDDEKTNKDQIDDLYSEYRNLTYQILSPLQDAPLKSFLFSLVGKILKDV